MTAEPTIPRGSTVLVTGANGFLGSHIADQFIRHGYKVRGTVRDSVKESWLVDLFGPENIELVSVADMSEDDAFDQVIKGVSAVAHSASVMTFGPDPNQVVSVTVSGALNAIKAAYAEASVKQFVLTSSSSAAVTSFFEREGITVTEETWNEEAVRTAWKDPPYEPDRGPAVYHASKVQAEQAVWKYHEDHCQARPDLIVNAVLPNFLLGGSVDLANQGNRTSAAFVEQLWKGQVLDTHRGTPRQYFVDVQDAAILHVAAVVFPHAQNQRIFAFADRFSWDAILDILRKIDPQRKFPDHFSGGTDPNKIEPRAKAEALLKAMGLPGWTSLEDSIRMNVRGLQSDAVQGTT